MMQLSSFCKFGTAQHSFLCHITYFLTLYLFTSLDLQRCKMIANGAATGEFADRKGPMILSAILIFSIVLTFSLKIRTRV
jgi:hypothetical protein